MIIRDSISLSYVEDLIDNEWFQFSQCYQDDYDTEQLEQSFHSMRFAWYQLWNDDALISRLSEFYEALKDDRNFFSEIYLSLLKDTDPEKYKTIKNSSSLQPEEKVGFVSKLNNKLVQWSKAVLVSELTKKLVQWSKDSNVQQNTILTGSGVHKDTERNYIKIEAYLSAEFNTCSFRTLQHLRKYYHQPYPDEDYSFEQLTEQFIIYFDEFLCSFTKTGAEFQLPNQSAFNQARQILKTVNDSESHKNFVGSVRGSSMPGSPDEDDENDMDMFIGLEDDDYERAEDDREFLPHILQHLDASSDDEDEDDTTENHNWISSYELHHRDANTPNRVPIIQQQEITKVQFSAIAPRNISRGETEILYIVMYEKRLRAEVEKLLKEDDDLEEGARSGIFNVRSNVKVTIQLSSPDIPVEDNIEEAYWYGEYQKFSFFITLPETYNKKQILFTAAVYINHVIATKLKFIVECKVPYRQELHITQADVLSAFVSYASEDRNKVALIIEGMQRARPDMDIFFDVDAIRSGEYWDKVILDELKDRDTLFLCWSHNAKNSEWVDNEWRYFYRKKGIGSIEPIPLELPSKCPPPVELNKKQFNDKMLYFMKSNPDNEF